jgi:hypothetical protein
MNHSSMARLHREFEITMLGAPVRIFDKPRWSLGKIRLALESFKWLM